MDDEVACGCVQVPHPVQSGSSWQWYQPACSTFSWLTRLILLWSVTNPKHWQEVWYVWNFQEQAIVVVLQHTILPVDGIKSQTLAIVGRKDVDFIYFFIFLTVNWLLVPKYYCIYEWGCFIPLKHVETFPDLRFPLCVNTHQDLFSHLTKSA